jgi:Protein of unknown function (DUF1036)
MKGERMKSLLVTSITILLLMMPAHAELRVCNSLSGPVRLAVVWVNSADAKTQDVPFTTQGWWYTDPGSCTNVSVDGVLMFYHLEWGLPPLFTRSSPVEDKYRFDVVDDSFQHFSRSGRLPNGREGKFAKFSAFPLVGKGHWLLLTLTVGPNGVTETCTATSGTSSMTTKC